LRSFKHWSLRYIFDRSIDKIYRFSHPDLPWLTPSANLILSSYLRPTDRGLEFGSGKSTIWFSGRIASLVSIEHNQDWYEKVTRQLKLLGRKNVTFYFRPREAEGKVLPSYVEAAMDIQDGSLDFVLVDGVYRDLCAKLSIEKLVHGGLLIIDNVNLYLPCNSRCPNSIRLDQQPVTQNWVEVFENVRTWRSFWTSDGVADTAIFIKP
jgi:predicted O-methyltransferase YrrM